MKMNKPQPETTITVSCPSGHRLRGGTAVLGKTVKCPKCQTSFVFAPTKSNQSDHCAVTDTGVMRILGDMPQLPSPAQPIQRDNRAVTDTGVMRILGDELEFPLPPKQPTEAKTRPCSRCDIAILDSLAVCPHCNFYIGVMPSFMEKMTDNPKTSRN
jgi:hypothetical protein